MTLEQLLTDRLGGDTRALTAVIEGGRHRQGVRILFGALGDLPRIILGVEGDTVTVLSPSGDTSEAAISAAIVNADEARDRHLAGINGATVVTSEPPDPAKGEWVDDNDPLQPGENPEDALARLENSGGVEEPRVGDGAGAPVNETTAVVGLAAPGAEDAMAEVKGRDDGSAQQATNVESAATTEQPNPAPASNADATAAAANETGGANGVEGESVTGNAPAAKPVFVSKDDHNKADLLALAGQIGAEADDNMTKAEIAQAINAKTGAVPPTE